MVYIDIIIEYGYIGIVNVFYIEEILSFVVISLVSKRFVYVKEFLSGLDFYGLKDII